MAAIHEQRNSFMHNMTSLAEDPVSCMCRGVMSDGWEWFLPITRRGHFFQDSFFENARSQFDAAVRDVLGRCNENTSFLMNNRQDNATSNNLSLYRQLRSRDLKEENQAVTVTTDNTSHKIVLDVHDFMDGDVKVKVIAEKEVLVQGSIKAEKNGGSSMTFSRRFIMPEDVDVEDISSVMSSDGILTITVPKKASYINQAAAKTTTSNQASSHVSQSISNATSSSTKESVGSMSTTAEKQRKMCESDRYCESCYKKLLSGKKTIEESENKQEKKIPISINSSLLNGGISESFKKQQSSQSVCNEKMNVSSANNSEVTSSSKRGDQSLFSENKEVKKCVTNKNESGVLSNHLTGNITRKTDTASSTQIPISMNFRPLPIVRRGLFFNDSIFENARNDFQNAVREVLANWGQQTSILDELSCYRNLRTQDLRDENQAVKISEDERNHKFVLDVQDFQNGGEVNVKAVDDRELVVEGKVERQEGGSKATKKFFKRFVVPHDIILDSVTSVMSSDGVLTITAPKRPPTIEIKDVTSPIITEQTSSLLSQGTNNNKCNVTQTASSNSRSSQESSESSIHQKTQSHQNVSSNEHIIPVHVEEADSEVQNNGQQRSSVVNQEVNKERNNVTQTESSHARISNDSSKSTIQQQTQSHQNVLPKEHIIPVHVEASASEMQNNCQQRVINQETNKERRNVTQMESSNGRTSNDSSKSSIHQQTQSHQNVSSKEYIIPVHVEETASEVQNNCQKRSSVVNQEANTERRNVTQTESSSARTSNISSESTIHQNNQSHQNGAPKEHIIPVHVEENTSESQNISHHSTSKNSLAREYVIPVSIENSRNGATCNANSRVTTSESEKVMNNNKSSNVLLSSHAAENSTSISKSSETNRRDICINKSNGVKKSEESIGSMASKQQTSLEGCVGSSSVVGRLIPINKRGSFFNDTFFEGSRNNFHTAVGEVLRKFNAENIHTDAVTAYRGLRQRCLMEESQAMSLHEDDQSHKVILDVNDFTNGDISVSIVGERELVIEGRMEKKSESSADSQSFCRRILLPDSVDVQSITSAISNDGILTVESAKSGSSGTNGARKTSSEAESRRESHDGSGHRWEQKAVKESSEKSDGYKSHSYSTSYKAHESSTKVF